MRYAHVLEVVSDPATYSSVSASPTAVMRETPIIFEDPPAHTLHRKLVQHAFTPKRVAEMEPWIERMVEALLDEIGTGPVEIIARFCDRLPVKVIAQLMGVPSEDDATLKEWSDGRSTVIGHSGTPPETADDIRRLARAEEGNRRLLDLFQTTLRARREQPGDDLVSALASASADGDTLSDQEIVGICALLLTAGNVTTTNLLGNLLNLLAESPARYASLRADRSLVEPVVEEMLRLESPVQWLFRRTTRDVVLGDVAIPAGNPLMVYFGAANRDSAAFEDPATFRLDRASNAHLGFGYGIHFCIGAPLARLEARVALNGFLDRYAAIEHGSEPTERVGAGPTHCGFARLALNLGQ
jgi:cytochrome P450